jgi:hypothetical protein
MPFHPIIVDPSPTPIVSPLNASWEWRQYLSGQSTDNSIVENNSYQSFRIALLETALLRSYNTQLLFKLLSPVASILSQLSTSYLPIKTVNQSLDIQRLSHATIWTSSNFTTPLLPAKWRPPVTRHLPVLETEKVTRQMLSCILQGPRSARRQKSVFPNLHHPKQPFQLKILKTPQK